MQDSAPRRHVLAAIDQVAGGLAAGAYDATPGPHCKDCEFTNLCTYSEANR